MKAKFNKLCSFDMDIAVKLDKEPNRTANTVIIQAVKAHYESRILPDGCRIHTVDITDFILKEIEKAEKVDAWLDGAKLRVSSYMVGMDDENQHDKINFMLKSGEFDIDIRFNIIIENDEKTVQFEKWTGGSVKYQTMLDNNRISEIELRASWKL